MSSAIALWPDMPLNSEKMVPSWTPYLLPGDEPRPAVLVIPGGGYAGVCESTEGRPVAEAFNRLGVHAFVLIYRTAPDHFPAPLLDGLRAMKIIRGRAAEWHVIPDEITACGFSAGGHLAGSLGLFPEEADASCGDEFDNVDPRPNTLFLSYPVASFEPWSHQVSAENYCGIVTEKEIARFSLDRRVTEKTPPMFLWHTVRDQMVSYRNSTVLAEAMAKAGRPCEFHLFPYGDHGMLKGLDTADVSSWMTLAMGFLETCRRARKPDFLECYTHAHQVAADKKLRAAQEA